MTVTLAQRLNRIISEQGQTKTEFAKSIGVTQNYICILTSEISSSARDSKLSPSLAQLIGLKYGYDPDWILYGDKIKEDEAVLTVDTEKSCASYRKNKHPDYKRKSP